MPSINNLRASGPKKTIGKIFYQENLQYGLKLIITQQYTYHGGNDLLSFEAGICDSLITSGNGIQYYFDAGIFCCDSQSHINDLISSTNSSYMPVVPKFEADIIFDFSFTSQSGFLIKRYVEQLRQINEGNVWKYVWRVEIGNQKLIELVKNTIS